MEILQPGGGRENVKTILRFIQSNIMHEKLKYWLFAKHSSLQIAGSWECETCGHACHETRRLFRGQITSFNASQLPESSYTRSRRVWGWLQWWFVAPWHVGISDTSWLLNCRNRFDVQQHQRSAWVLATAKKYHQIEYLNKSLKYPSVFTKKL